MNKLPDEPSDEPPKKLPDINPVFNFTTKLGVDFGFGFDVGVDIDIGLGNSARLGTNFSNDCGIARLLAKPCP